MDTAPGGAEAELESLTQFLYLAPIGLVQASMDGEILLLNPMSAQLLMPLARDAELSNLFDVLAGLAPDLRARTEAFGLPHGRVCDNVPLRIAGATEAAAQILSLTLLKLDETRLMAVLNDVSAAVRRDAALRQSRSWITTLLAGRGDYALVPLDRHGSIHAWNDAAAELTGFAAEQAVGRSIALFDVDGPTDGERVEAKLEAARREGWHLDEGGCRRPDGTCYRGHSLIVPLDPGSEDGPAFCFVLRRADGDAADPGVPPAADDVREPPAAHGALLRFLYQAPIGLLQTGADGEIAMINPMSAQLLMPLVPDGNLLNLFDALGSVAPDLRGRAAATSAAGGVVCDDLRFEVRTPETRGVTLLRTLAISVLKLDAGTLVASVTDVSLSVERERAQIRSTLKGASRIDPLTQLPNRSVAIERIGAALVARRAEPAAGFAVIVVNCDRFDRVNVTLGSAVGDELLRAVGQRLSGTLRRQPAPGGQAPAGPAAARLGADEFVLLVHDLADDDAAAAIARRVVDVFAEPFLVGERRVHLTASVGVVDCPLPNSDAEEVLQSANIAMQDAKRAGGARWRRFEPTMKDRAARRGSVESELRIAIAAGELFVVYQPIVDPGGECSAVEALVRWRHPVHGIVPPTDFIEIAEETGLIEAIGDFVLTESCAQLARWQQTLGRAAPATVSVNVSKAQLHDGQFLIAVRRALATSGLAAARLQLEVTESLAGSDETVRSQLHELKALGLGVALDDFGTGYSSLSSLHQLPVDVVKIDRSFVSQLESSAHHRVLVEATVKVARSLGMRTVAEGIETAGQAAELARLGCDKGQGYFYARPMEADEAADWLRARAAAIDASLGAAA